MDKANGVICLMHRRLEFILREFQIWRLSFYDGFIAIHVTSWWRHQTETFSALLVLCAGNSPVNCKFPLQRPVTRSFDIFFDLCLNKRLSRQSWGWCFETPSYPYDVRAMWHAGSRYMFSCEKLLYGFMYVSMWHLDYMCTSKINHISIWRQRCQI